MSWPVHGQPDLIKDWCCHAKQNNLLQLLGMELYFRHNEWPCKDLCCPGNLQEHLKHRDQEDRATEGSFVSFGMVLMHTWDVRAELPDDCSQQDNLVKLYPSREQGNGGWRWEPLWGRA